MNSMSIIAQKKIQVQILIIKPTRCTNFSNSCLEWNSTCFRQFLCPSSGVFHCTHSNGTCYTGLLTACEQDQDGFPSWTCSQFVSNGICHTVLLTACEQDQDGVPSWSCSQAVSKPVWHIPSLYVQWKTPDDGQRNCLKHAEFYSKNKFEKLVHLVGSVIRIYHDARSPERQIKVWYQQHVVWKMKQRFYSLSYKCHKFHWCPNIYNVFVTVFSNMHSHMQMEVF